jgi:hypothetical protein
MSLAGYAPYVRDYSNAAIPRITWSANEAGDVIEIVGSYPSSSPGKPDQQASRMVTPTQLAAGAENAIQDALKVLEGALVPEDQRPEKLVF